jgi:hypothetical protein
VTATGFRGLARAVALALTPFALGLCPAPVSAAVVAPAPGRTVTLVEEDTLLVFDPLTSSQTVIMQLEVEGTASPFGLLIPTPKPAEVVRVSERVRRALRGMLHPRAQVQRILDVEYYSWAASCAVRDVGEDDDPEAAEARVPTAAAELTPLGNAPERLHDWLLKEGFTLAPAQAAWLSELRTRGWSVVGVTVRPPVTEGPPPSRLRGPVLAITHEAEEPIYAAAMPPFAVIDEGEGERPPLELAVLSEWAVSVDAAENHEPFFADAVSGRDVLRLASEAGGNPWNFRRDGTLTAFEIDRPRGLGIVRFVRTEPRPTIHPPVRHEMKTHRLRVPVELLVLALSLLIWTWMRYARRNGPGPRVTFRG